MAALHRYVRSCPDRESNVATMLAHIEAAIKGLRSAGRQGKQSVLNQEKVERLERARRKLSETELLLVKWERADAARSGSSHQPSQSSTPTKRLRSKRGADDVVDDAAEPQQRRVTYDRNFQGLLRTRAYAKGLGVQACPRRLQRLLCPDTHDFDIQNAVFVILHQLIKKLQGSIDVPDFVLETIQRCAEHGNIICEEDMETSIKEGKHVLHEVLFGAVVPACYAHVGFLSQLHKTSIYMRWLACSLL